MIVYRHKRRDGDHAIRVTVTQSEPSFWRRLRGEKPEVRVYNQRERIREPLPFPEFLFGFDGGPFNGSALQRMSEVIGIAPLTKEERFANAKERGISYDVEASHQSLLAIIKPKVTT